MSTILATIISSIIAAVIAVLGWFVINHLNKIMRKEEAQRELYNRILDATNNLSNSLSILSLSINKDAADLKNILQFLSSTGVTKEAERQNQIDKWYKIVTLMIDSIGKTGLNIKTYLNNLEMGGTDFGSETSIYQGLRCVGKDTTVSLLNITNKWVNFINFNGMTEIQLDSLINETKKDLQQVDEFDRCLNDVLVHLYNKYVASPLKLRKNSLKNTQGRRYISQKGLIDDRPF